MWPAIKAVRARLASTCRSRARWTSSPPNHPHQYIGTPLASRTARATATSTADATDQCSVFSVTDARIGVIAAGLPVTGSPGFDGCDAPQPLDPLVAVVERHDQSRRRTTLRAEGCFRKPEGHDDLRPQRSCHIEEVNICAVR